MAAEDSEFKIEITSEGKSAIRQSLLSVLTELKSYDGSAAKDEAYIAAAIAFEHTLKTQLPQLSQGAGIPAKVEQAILTEIFGERQAGRRTIYTLLDRTNARYTHLIQRALRDKEHQPEIYYHTLPGVLLPPGQGTITTGTGEGSGFEKPTFKPRLEALLLLLKTHGVYLDHIGIFEGGLLPNQLRQTSYRLVELSSPLAQILVCDQVGEATFVIRPRLSRETLLSLTKEELQKQHPTIVTRIIDSSTWDAKIIQALFTADATESQPSQPKKSKDKLSLRTQEELRADITARYTPATWAALKYKEKDKLKFHNLGLTIIATYFDLQGLKPIGRGSDHLALGRAIWGEDCPELQEITQKKLRADITARYTPATWAAMTQKEKIKFNSYNLGLRIIATYFGQKGLKSVGHHSDHLALGRAIWGEDCPELQEITQKKLRADITARYTPATWAAMKYEEKEKFTYRNLGLIAIAAYFGMRGLDPRAHLSDHLTLGRAIWGEDHPELQESEKIEVTLDMLRADLMARYTPATWVTLRHEEKLKLKSYSFGLIAIATRFGLKGLNPKSRYADYFVLGRAIWGDEWVEPEVGK